MGYSQTKIGRLAVVESGSWGDTGHDWDATVAAIDCEAPSFTLTQESLTIDGLRSAFEEPTHLSGSKMNSSMSFKCFLNGWSSTSPGNPSLSMGVSGSIHPIGLLFKHALGGHAVDDPESDLAGGTVGAINTTTATGEKFTPGHCFNVETSTSGKRNNVWVSSVADGGGGEDTITPTVDMSIAPNSTGTLYGSHVLYLSSGQLSVPLAFKYQGSDSGSKIEMYDCTVTSLKLTLSALGPPELDVEVSIGTWISEDGGAITAYSNQFPTINASIGTNGARLMLGGSEQQSVSLEIDISCEYANALSHAADQGLAQRVCTNRTTTTTLTIPSTALYTDIAGPGDTKGILQLDLNANTPGNSMSVLVPNTVVRESSPIGDSEGLISVAYTFGANVYTGDYGSTAPADTPFRVAFL